MALPILRRSDSHLPEAEQSKAEEPKKSRIVLPGGQTAKAAMAKLIIPAKRIFAPAGAKTAADVDASLSADAPELQLAVRFNRQMRRNAIRVASRMRRRQLRREARRERSLQQAFYDASASSHHFEGGKLVRRSAAGELLPVVSKPPAVDIRPRTGYLEANGPKELRKSEAQRDLEDDRGARTRLAKRVAVLVDARLGFSAAPEGRAYWRYGEIRVSPPQAVLNGTPKRRKGSFAWPRAKQASGNGEKLFEVERAA